MAGASRRVSPSGWLWNVCPRSPPRHRVAAAPSLTVVVVIGGSGGGGIAAAGAAGRSRGHQDPGIGGEVVRQPPNPPPGVAAAAAAAAATGAAAFSGEGRRGRQGWPHTVRAKAGRARPGITTTVDAARYFWCQVDIGLTCAWQPASARFAARLRQRRRGSRARCRALHPSDSACQPASLRPAITWIRWSSSAEE